MVPTVSYLKTYIDQWRSISLKRSVCHYHISGVNLWNCGKVHGLYTCMQILER